MHPTRAAALLASIGTPAPLLLQPSPAREFLRRVAALRTECADLADQDTEDRPGYPFDYAVRVQAAAAEAETLCRIYAGDDIPCGGDQKCSFSLDGEPPVSLSTMLAANADDEGLCAWLRTARTGEIFPAFVKVEAVAAPPADRECRMEWLTIARDCLQAAVGMSCSDARQEAEEAAESVARFELISARA